MFLTSTNEAEISLVIKKLKNKYSTDFQGLNNFILKNNRICYSSYIDVFSQ